MLRSRSRSESGCKSGSNSGTQSVSRSMSGTDPDTDSDLVRGLDQMHGASAQPLVSHLHCIQVQNNYITIIILSIHLSDTLMRPVIKYFSPRDCAVSLCPSQANIVSLAEVKGQKRPQNQNDIGINAYSVVSVPIMPS